jgi:hypothetical protein
MGPVTSAACLCRACVGRSGLGEYAEEEYEDAGGSRKTGQVFKIRLRRNYAICCQYLGLDASSLGGEHDSSPPAL